MNPRAQLGWTLATALILWMPVAVKLLGGNVDLVKGGAYFLAALAIGWFGVGFIGNMMAGYSRQAQEEAHKAMLEIQEIERRHILEDYEQRRRSTDQRSGTDSDGTGETGNETGPFDPYDDDAPVIQRPRRSDQDADLEQYVE